MFVPKNSTPPDLIRVKLDDLRPTQITVGKISAKNKQKKIAALKNEFAVVDYMREHPIPAVLGYNGKYFCTDHHHLLFAATELGIEMAYVTVIDDFSYMDKHDFWKAMLSRELAHPIDEDGTMREWSKVPKKFDELKDDPYRSVAAFVRDAKAYNKTDKPFAEFQWAEFFRKHIPIEVVQQDFTKAVYLGCKLAKQDMCKHLPGWINSEVE